MGNSREDHGKIIEDGALVSIIIPIYNVREYLDQCVESVLAQSYRNLEIILVNDGSTDGSEQMAVDWSYRDGRILAVSKTNGGLGSARNTGVKAARGEYIAFLDSDDWLDPDYIFRLYQTARRTGADMVFCDYYIFDNQTGAVRGVNTVLDTPDVMELSEVPQLLYGANVAMWVKLYSRRFFLEHEIVIPSIPYEDTATYGFIAASCERIARVREKLLYYRVNRKNSILYNFENRRRAVDALACLCERMRAGGYFQQYNQWLERFCVRFTSYTVRELKQLQDSQRDIGRLTSFLGRNFPGWENPYGKRYLVMGSNNLYCMVNQITYDIDLVQRTKLSQLPPQDGWDLYDYVLIDLQPDEVADVKEEPCLDALRRLYSRVSHKKLYFVKNRLALCWGEYTAEREFEECEAIRNINSHLDQIEKRVGEEFQELHFIETGPGHLHFADIHSRHKCSPCHLNDMFFLRMADRIIDTIGRRNLYGEDKRDYPCV